MKLTPFSERKRIKILLHYNLSWLLKKIYKNIRMSLGVTGRSIGIFVDAAFALINHLKSVKADAIPGEDFQTRGHLWNTEN